MDQRCTASNRQRSRSNCYILCLSAELDMNDCFKLGALEEITGRVWPGVWRLLRLRLVRVAEAMCIIWLMRQTRLYRCPVGYCIRLTCPASCLHSRLLPPWTSADELSRTKPAVWSGIQCDVWRGKCALNRVFQGGTSTRHAFLWT